jgi:hypothetical protein
MLCIGGVPASNASAAEITDAELLAYLKGKSAEARTLHKLARDAWISFQQSDLPGELQDRKEAYLAAYRKLYMRSGGLPTQADSEAFHKARKNLVETRKKCRPMLRDMEQAREKLVAMAKEIQKKYGSALTNRWDLGASIKVLDGSIVKINAMLSDLKSRRKILAADADRPQDIRRLMIDALDDRLRRVEQSLERLRKERHRLLEVARANNPKVKAIGDIDPLLNRFLAVIQEIHGYKRDAEIWYGVIDGIRERAIVRDVLGSVVIADILGRQSRIQSGAPLVPGKSIRTGANGYAWIQFECGASLEVGPNANVKYEERRPRLSSTNGMLRLVGPAHLRYKSDPRFVDSHADVVIRHTDVVLRQNTLVRKPEIYLPAGQSVRILSRLVGGRDESSDLAIPLDDVHKRRKLTGGAMDRLFREIRGFRAVGDASAGGASPGDTKSAK